jgi:branched-chain amino acid transport system permease protein
VSAEQSRAFGRQILPVAGIGLVGVLPVLLGGSNSLLNIAVLIGIYFIVCIGLSLIFGIGGQLSLAQAAFYGIGAYTSALFTTKLGAPVLLGFCAAALTAGVIGWILAAPILRLRTVYLAMATLAFGEILITLIRENRGLTGGSTGLLNLPAPAVGPFAFDTPLSYYYLVWTVALAAAWVARNIIRSRIGLGLRALSDTEIGAASCGVDVARFKTWMFTLGAVLAGIAGALFVHYITFISPDSFSVSFSILMVMILAIGGRDSLAGALLGAIAVTVLPILLASYDRYSELIFGVLFLAAVMFLPNGLAGAGSSLVRRLTVSARSSGERASD